MSVCVRCAERQTSENGMSISTKGANKTQSQTTDNVEQRRLWMGKYIKYICVYIYVCLTVCQMKCFTAMKMGKLLPVFDVVVVATVAVAFTVAVSSTSRNFAKAAKVAADLNGFQAVK